MAKVIKRKIRHACGHWLVQAVAGPYERLRHNLEWLATEVCPECKRSEYRQRFDALPQLKYGASCRPGYKENREAVAARLLPFRVYLEHLPAWSRWRHMRDKCIEIVDELLEENDAVFWSEARPAEYTKEWLAKTYERRSRQKRSVTLDL